MTYIPQLRVANLRSKQGRKIAIEYIINATTPDTDLTGYQSNMVNFRIPGYPHERMTAVLVNRFYIPGDEGMSQEVYIRQLTGDDGVFSGIVGEPVDCIIQLFGTTFAICQPQFALCIDGVWQTDPIQQGEQHNFNFAWMI